MTTPVRTVAVVGGGPAGLMAAEIVAAGAATGTRVLVFDMHRSMGRKLLLAGRSGLNLTHSEPIDALLERFTPCPAVLESAIRQFDPDALRAWARGLGEATFVGSSGRVFPESFRAAPLLRAWLGRLASAGVEFRPRHRFTGWTDDGALRFGDGDGDGDGEIEVVVRADAAVLACGGASWPRVGGDGSWLEALATREPSVRPLVAANCGVVVAWTPVFMERFEGHPVKNVVVRTGSTEHRGELVVTRDGLEGGPVYAASRLVREELAAAGRSGFRLDLVPDLTPDRLQARLATRRPKDSQSTWLRRAGLPPVAIGLVREATGNRIPDDAVALAALLRELPLAVTSVAPIERAISSVGGVPFEAVDDRLMLSAAPGTFVAGEMLDWDAPTGGYLLQACFATGAAAGRGVLEWLDR